MVKTKFTEGMSSLLDSEFLSKFDSFIHKMCHKTASCIDFSRGMPVFIYVAYFVNN